eukprot:scaffold147585_cov33-Tisochrysis_lutea.AAC.1
MRSPPADAAAAIRPPAARLSVAISVAMRSKRSAAACAACTDGRRHVAVLEEPSTAVRRGSFLRGPLGRTHAAMRSAVWRGQAAGVTLRACQSCSSSLVCSHSPIEPWLIRAMMKKAGRKISWLSVPKAHRLHGVGKGAKNE